jgi:hypothetical protein
MSGLLYRFTDATAGKIFAPSFGKRDASAFSIFCVYGSVYSKEAKPSPLLRVSPRFGCKVLRAFLKEF